MARPSIRRPNGKAIAKLAVVFVLGVVALVAAGIVARSYSGITRSQETNEVFTAAATPPAELFESVTWQADPPDLKRKMEPLTRTDVTSAWLRAWEQLSVVAQTGDTSGLETYFADSALEGLLASADDRIGLPVHQLGHVLLVDFYSKDGQVIGLIADEVSLIRAIEVGGVTGWKQTVESYEAVLLLEDGNWRIQHWVRRGVDEHWWTEPAAPGTDRLPTVVSQEVGSPLAVNGINYVPRDVPVAEMWTAYNPEDVAADLDRIVAAGLDSVRVFLPFEELGGPKVTEAELSSVDGFLDLADDRGLGVVITLFDGSTDHRPSTWSGDSKYIETVVGALGSHPALIMWDLKDEPDRDISAFGVGEQLTYAWLDHIARAVRNADPATPMTVGWSSPEAALGAPIHTDVVSFHYYKEPELLPAYGAALHDHAGDRPVLMTEFGSSSWNSLWPGGDTETHQAAYFADILTNARAAELDGTMAWTLWDLAISPDGSGPGPWSAGRAKSHGLLRGDGSAKPVLAVVDPTVDLARFDRVGRLSFLGLKASRLMIGVATGGIALSVLVRRRRGPR